MPEDKYAYRCSGEFSRAILERIAQQQRFTRDVWATWETRNPLLKVWGERKPASMDFTIQGFAQDDPHAKIPGLSMSLRKGYAVPSRGRAGDRWRVDLETLRARPSLDEVFTQFGVSTGLMDFLTLTPANIGMEIAPEGIVYLICVKDIMAGLDKPPEAISRIALSEFYALRENNERVREVAHKRGH